MKNPHGLPPSIRTPQIRMIFPRFERLTATFFSSSESNARLQQLDPAKSAPQRGSLEANQCYLNHSLLSRKCHCQKPSAVEWFWIYQLVGSCQKWWKSWKSSRGIGKLRQDPAIEQWQVRVKYPCCIHHWCMNWRFNRVLPWSSLVKSSLEIVSFKPSLVKWSISGKIGDSIW